MGEPRIETLQDSYESSFLAVPQNDFSFPGLKLGTRLLFLNHVISKSPSL